MAEVMVVEMPSGGQLYFGRARGAGLSEVGLGDDVAKAARGQFEKALGTMGDLVALLDRNLRELAQRPSKVEMEFGASLSGDCNLWIVSGEGKAEFKVKLVWEAAKSEGVSDPAAR